MQWVLTTIGELWPSLGDFPEKDKLLWDATGETLTSIWFWMNLSSLLAYFPFAHKGDTEILPLSSEVISKLVPCLEHNTISIFQGCLLYKPPWKDGSEQQAETLCSEDVQKHHKLIESCIPTEYRLRRIYHTQAQWNDQLVISATDIGEGTCRIYST